MTIARMFKTAAASFAVLAVFASGALAASAVFDDVPDDHPAAAEIEAAHQIGVFNGYGDGTFRPDGKLTQRQAENVIWRMLSWHGTDDDGNFEISRADAAVLAMTGLCGLDGDRIPACDDVNGDPEATETTETGTLVELCAEPTDPTGPSPCADVAPARVSAGDLVQVRIPAGKDQCRVYQSTDAFTDNSSFYIAAEEPKWIYSGGDLYEVRRIWTGYVRLEHRLRIRCRAGANEYVARIVVEDNARPAGEVNDTRPQAPADDASAPDSGQRPRDNARWESYTRKLSACQQLLTGATTRAEYEPKRLAADECIVELIAEYPDDPENDHARIALGNIRRFTPNFPAPNQRQGLANARTLLGRWPGSATGLANGPNASHPAGRS